MDNAVLLTEVFGSSIRFGVGAVSKLAQYVKELNATKVLVVTDKGVTEAGIVDKVVHQLDVSSIEYTIFDDVQPDPIDANVMHGLEVYRNAGCDAIIGLGGGSPMDVAKAIRIVASHPGHISQYYEQTITAQMPPLISIPTTAGTGSEVSTGAMITDTGENRKRVIRPGPPSLALVDPELTVTMPASLTAATGMDALCHCVEAYVARRFNPLADALAIAGTTLVAENLKRAVENGKDIEARKNMAMASSMGALAFRKGLGAVHSLAHALSTDADMPHGVANAIMMPYVMEFNAEVVANRYADVARSMGANVWGMSPREAARSAVESVRQLSRDTGLPQRLRDAGVKAEVIPVMAAKAMADHCHPFNPRDCTEEDMAALYRAAF